MTPPPPGDGSIVVLVVVAPGSGLVVVVVVLEVHTSSPSTLQRARKSFLHARRDWPAARHAATAGLHALRHCLPRPAAAWVGTIATATKRPIRLRACTFGPPPGVLATRGRSNPWNDVQRPTRAIPRAMGRAYSVQETHRGECRPRGAPRAR